jgi:uncharacterized NAD-dependent epimerase/dehydratase family protein
VEQEVLRVAEGAGPDALVLVEGQGSFCHPGSTATLPLLRGSQPTDLLLVHRAGQTAIRNQPQIPLPPIPRLIAALKAMAALTGLPCHDPVRDGGQFLLADLRQGWAAAC